MKCFYHKTDLDGKCSGAIVKSKCPECEIIGVDYRDSVHDFNIDPGETVYIVDFSFPIIEMVYLNQRAKVYWIDHHKSIIHEAWDADFIASGGQLLEIGRGACELVWEYIYPDKKVPFGVRLLSLYDVWDHADPNVLPFQYGMRQREEMLPDSTSWVAVFISDSFFLSETIKIGKVILDYQQKQDEIYAKGMAYETIFHGYRALVMNKPHSNSKAFDSIFDPEKHDIMVLFGVKPGEIKYTLFCDKPEIDVSAIAKIYGGGGHQGAAGFYTERLIV